MTAPLTTLRHGRQRRKTMRGLRYLFSKPSVFEIADRSKRNGIGISGASGKRNSQAGAAQTHRLDNFLEWAITKQGRENTALFFLTFGCIAGIYVIHRYA
jgi:hypothetical protein